MGEVGVAVVGPHSPWYNPAAVGMMANTHRANLTFFPFKSNYREDSFRERNFSFLSGTVSVLRQTEGSSLPLNVGLAFYRTDWEQGIDGDYPRRTRTDAISLGISYRGSIDVSLGATYKRPVFREWSRYPSPYGNDEEANAIDVGAIVGFGFGLDRSDDLRLAVTLGSSWRNLAVGRLEFHGECGYRQPLEKRWRIGLSTGLVQRLSRETANSLLVVVEYERQLNYWDDAKRTRMWHLGIEIGIEEVLYLRAGHVFRPGNDQERAQDQVADPRVTSGVESVYEEGFASRSNSFTTGLTLSSAGIFGTPTIDPAGAGNGGLMDKLVVELSFAYYPKRDDQMMYKSSFLSLDIAWRY
jgi:hypothetical protein